MTTGRNVTFVKRRNFRSQNTHKWLRVGGRLEEKRKSDIFFLKRVSKKRPDQGARLERKGGGRKLCCLSSPHRLKLGKTDDFEGYFLCGNHTVVWESGRNVTFVQGCQMIF